MFLLDQFLILFETFFPCYLHNKKGGSYDR